MNDIRQVAGSVLIFLVFVAVLVVLFAAAGSQALASKPPLQTAVVVVSGLLAAAAALALIAGVLSSMGVRIPVPGEMFGLISLALLSFLLPAAAVAVSVVTIGTVEPNLLTQAQVQIPIVLIASVLALLGGLSFIVIVLSHLRLTTPRYALGMPEGSIRAVLAISLLFLFMILSVFLYGALLAINTDAAKNSAIDIAKQLVTTVATLAVSVAGFYFGTGSVTAAAQAVARREPKLNLLSPTTPQTLPKAKGTQLPDIRLGPDPASEAVTWRIVGDDDGKLEQTAPNRFTYTRGTNPSDVVTLEFSLQSNPNVTAKLEVDAPKS